MQHVGHVETRSHREAFAPNKARLQVGYFRLEIATTVLVERLARHASNLMIRAPYSTIGSKKSNGDLTDNLNH